LNKNRNKLSAGRPSERNKALTFAQLSDDAPDMKRVNFQISAELHAKLKVYSANVNTPNLVQDSSRKLCCLF
jgi:hypothetical protein